MCLVATLVALSIVAAEASYMSDKYSAPRLPQRSAKRQHGHQNLHSSSNLRSEMNGGKMTIASVQYPPISGSSPAASIAHNAASILSIAISATTNAALTSPLELISFPEFALFGNQDIDSMCSNDTTKATLFAPYCEFLPAVGTEVDCSAADVATTPYKIIACGLMMSPNPQTKNLLVSYNTCQNNVNSTAPSFYNTQVVVGGGKVVAIYHKFHPFITKCFDTPPLGLVTFNTLVSNVTFGVFTCFDIMFSSPKEDLVHMGVKYFSYSAAIPLVFKAAIELFSGLNNVTVAASNLNGESVIVVDGKETGSSCPMSVSDACIAVATVPIV